MSDVSTASLENNLDDTGRRMGWTAATDSKDNWTLAGAAGMPSLGDARPNTSNVWKSIPDSMPHPSKPTPPPAPADDGTTEFLNAEMLKNGGPTHPSTGVFMRGPYKGKTPSQARETLLASRNAGGNTGRGPGGGLVSGAGKTSEAAWRGTFGAKTDAATVGTGAGNTAPFRGSTAGEVEQFNDGAHPIASIRQPNRVTSVVSGLAPGQFAGSTFSRPAQVARPASGPQLEQEAKRQVASAPQREQDAKMAGTAQRPTTPQQEQDAKMRRTAAPRRPMPSPIAAPSATTPDEFPA